MHGFEDLGEKRRLGNAASSKMRKIPMAIPNAEQRTFLPPWRHKSSSQNPFLALAASAEDQSSPSLSADHSLNPANIIHLAHPRERQPDPNRCRVVIVLLLKESGNDQNKQRNLEYSEQKEERKVCPHYYRIHLIPNLKRKSASTLRSSHT